MSRRTGSLVIPLGGVLMAATLGVSSVSAQSPAAVPLTYATVDQQSVFEQGEKVVLDAFNAANPGIVVTAETTPFADYTTKLTTELRGGGGPDVGRINHTDVVALAQAGLLLPLDADIAAGTLQTADFAPGLLAIGQVDGSQYSLPLDTDARVLFYSPKLLAAAGVVDSAGAAVPPATWADLKAAALKVKDQGIAGFAYREDSDYAMAYEAVGPFMVAAGGNVLTATDGGAVASAATDAKTVAAVTFLQDLQASGVTPPGQRGMTQQTVAQLFANGQLAMFTGGPWMRDDILKANPDLEYGVDYATAAIPVMNAGDPTGTTSGGWQVGVFKNTQDRDAAIKLLSFITQPDNLHTIAVPEGFPPLIDGMSVEPWSSDPFFAAFAEVVPGGRVPILPVPQLSQVAAAFEKYVTAAVVDGQDVTEQLQAFDDEVNNQILQ